MRRDELEHLIRAAGGVLNGSALIVVGSQRNRLAETDCTEDERRRLSAAIQRDTSA